MSDGKTHLMTNSLCSAGILLSSYLFNVPQKELMSLAAGCILGTVFITPDLDMPVRTVTLKFWGPFGILWWPVLKLSKHRGRSHTYLQGPLFRLLYTALLLSPVLLWIYHKNLWHFQQNEYVCFLLAYFLLQWIHLWLDGISPSMRRL